MSSSFGSLWLKANSIKTKEYLPILFDPSVAEERDSLDNLVGCQTLTIHDSLNDQLEELVEMRAPGETLEGEALRERVSKYLGDTPIDLYGTYVYYPWCKEVLHILSRDEFIEVRTSRNQYQITPAEQARLGKMRIGIVGLSVGASTALTCALEGLGGELRIADFDTLSLSNTNRLRTSISNIGVKKAVICAREIAEINPYLQITIFSEGLDEDNVEEFLMGGGKLDMLIEECDDFFMKVFVRERARKHGIPVIMETNDRGMIDIERFDQEPDRPLLHGLMNGFDSSSLKGLSTKQKIPYLVKTVGSKNTVSQRALASLFEVGQTIKSWPQLASSVTLGAAIATDTARRVLLGEDLPSGRFYVDLKKIIAAGVTADLPDWSVLRPEAISQAASVLSVPITPQIVSTGLLQRDEVKYLVAYACLAPSGGNSQAWHFTYHQGRIDCSIDPSYVWTTMDFEGRSLYIAIGAAAENIVIAAQSIRLKAQISPGTGKESTAVCSIHFERAAPVTDPLFAAIPKRITNRHPADLSIPLSQAKIQALIDTASRCGANLRIVQNYPEKQKIANVIGIVDRIRFLHPGLHSDLVSELRWTRQDAHANNTGIGIDTLELSIGERIPAYLTTSWPAMQILRDADLGRELEKAGRERKTHAFALLSIPKKGVMGYVEGGRAMEQVWLEATLQELAFCPVGTCIFLWNRLEEGGGDVFSDREKEVLREARREFLEMFPKGEEESEILLVRLSETGMVPAARSLRRPVSEVLTTIE